MSDDAPEAADNRPKDPDAESAARQHADRDAERLRAAGEVHEQLRRVLEDVLHGRVPQRKVRKLLGYFGQRSRGSQVVATIHEKLEALGLQTDPDFRLPPLDNRVRFLPRGAEVSGSPVVEGGEERASEDPQVSASVEEPVEALVEGQMPPEPPGGAAAPAAAGSDGMLPPQRWRKDPTYLVSEMAAANRLPTMIAPDQSIGKAVHVMMEHGYSQLPVGTGPTSVKGMLSYKGLVRKLVVQKGGPCQTVGQCMKRQVRYVHWTDGFFHADSLTT